MNTIVWINPDTGQKYVITDLTLINFAYDDSGNLLYEQTDEAQYQFVVTETGELMSDVAANIYIDSNGVLTSYSMWEETQDATQFYTQQDINLLRARNKITRIKAILLDENYVELGDLVGTIRNVSYDITSNSNIRRVCNLTMHIQDKSKLNDFETLWVKHMVELHIGIYDFSTNEYVWYPLGRMLMKGGSSKFGATTQEVKMSLVDLMANITEDRGSQMGLDMLIPAGSSVRNAFISIITTFSEFKRYNIPEFEDVVPYDIVISLGKYPFDALTELINLFPYYEMFYDHEGIFTVQKIPTKIDDPVELEASIVDEMLIDANKDIPNFGAVKNTTEIWGRELDPYFMATACVSSGSTYQITIDDTFENLVNGDTYGFVPDVDSVSGQMIKIQDTDAIAVYTQAGDGSYTALAAGEMLANTAYVVKYTDLDEPRFVLQGELFIHVIVQEINEMPSEDEQARYKAANACDNVKWIVNPDSPYACSIEPTTQEIDRETRQVLQGGEYSNIYTTQLAYERASYENWLKLRVQDTVTMEMLLVPWMDVNQKIAYTSPVTENEEVLIVQSISYNFSNWTMTVTGQKFYPYYPWYE